METVTAVVGSSDQEWRVLEAQQTDFLKAAERNSDGLLTFYWPFTTGVKASSKAHPSSYRPDLPLRSSPGAVNAWADAIVRKQGAQKRTKASPKTVVRLSSPHPSSYRPDLPLAGFSDAALVRATAADKAYWQDHPLRYTKLEG